MVLTHFLIFALRKKEGYSIKVSTTLPGVVYNFAIAEIDRQKPVVDGDRVKIGALGVDEHCIRQPQFIDFCPDQVDCCIRGLSLSAKSRIVPELCKVEVHDVLL